jgi:hypothetical protein
LKLGLAIRFIHAKETTIGSKPQNSHAVFKENVDPVRYRFLTDWVNCETGLGLGLRDCARSSGRVQENYSSTVCRYPVRAVASLEQIIDGGRRKPIFNVVVGKAAPVEAAEPIAGAKPEESARVARNTGDSIVREAINCGVDPYRRAISSCNSDRSKQQRDKKDRVSNFDVCWFCQGRTTLTVTGVQSWRCYCWVPSQVKNADRGFSPSER